MKTIFLKQSFYFIRSYNKTITSIKKYPICTESFTEGGTFVLFFYCPKCKLIEINTRTTSSFRAGGTVEVYHPCKQLGEIRHEIRPLKITQKKFINIMKRKRRFLHPDSLYLLQEEGLL